jgi:hypothetical protein
MSHREFNWVDYEVSVPAPVAREMRWLTTARAAAPGVEAPGAPPEILLSIPLPNLNGYPTPRDKAKILLDSAAEVEHALMVQYLYAAYSLKGSDEAPPEFEDVLDEGFRRSWPQTLRAIAREEMGHFMTVQNLLIFLGLAPNFEREDCPPRDDLYPFRLKLQPLTRASLAKYVAAEAPGDATGIQDIIDLATEKAGTMVNRVGILYGLLGLVFARQDQIDPGATEDARWNAIVRAIRDAAYQQDCEPGHWHLPDRELHPETFEQQADPDDWNVGQLRVHRVKDRALAVDAIRDIGVQGEGPTSGDETAHFEQFLRIFRGGDGLPPFPPQGSWVPTRQVPINPKAEDFARLRPRGWAELANERYALLLGFLYHYLFATGEVRQILTGWIFAEMRSRLGFIARELTSMPLFADPSSSDRAAAPFKLPEQLTLPDDERARWRVHRERTTTAIAIATQLHSAGALDPLDGYLVRLLASDQARLETMTAMEEHAEPTMATSFVRDIGPLFRPKDIAHMAFRMDLAAFDDVRELHEDVVARVSDAESPMPPRPDLQRWIDEGFPP